MTFHIFDFAEYINFQYLTINIYATMQTINIFISVKFHIWTRVKYRNFDINNQKYFILITFIFLVFFLIICIIYKFTWYRICILIFVIHYEEYRNFRILHKAEYRSFDIFDNFHFVNSFLYIIEKIEIWSFHIKYQEISIFRVMQTYGNFHILIFIMKKVL